MINFGYNVLNCLFCNFYKHYKIENQAYFKLRYQDWKKEKRIKEAKKIQWGVGNCAKMLTLSYTKIKGVGCYIMGCKTKSIGVVYYRIRRYTSLSHDSGFFTF